MGDSGATVPDRSPTALRVGDVRWGKLIGFWPQGDGTVTARIGRFVLALDIGLVPKLDELLGQDVIVARAHGRDGVGKWPGRWTV